VSTSTPTTGSLSGNQIVTQIFRLNYESANNLLPVLRPLIAPNNTINVNPGNNSLVITDYAENMRRLARIIATLDVPNASDIEVIQLKHSVATDMVPLINRLLEGGGTAPGATGAPGQADASFKTALLAEPRGNSIIVRAANPARVQLVRSLVEKLDRAPLDTGNGAAGNVYVVYLKNADAVKLAVTLRAALSTDARGGSGSVGGGVLNQAQQQPQQQQPQTSGTPAGLNGTQSTASTSPLNNANQPSTGGSIQADPATNSLIITAAEPQYRQLRAVIDRLDGKRAQVLVEALIAEIDENTAAQFGIQWQAGIGNSTNQNVGVIGNNSSVTGTNIIDLALGIAAKTTTVLPAGGLNVGIGSKYGGQYVLSFLANFLQSTGSGNVLSTPTLLTLDNEEAKIVIGQNVPFVTGQFTNTGAANGSVNPFQTIERQDVGLTLRVRPQINENNSVKMSIYQEVSTILASTANNANGPTTNKRSIESNVSVDDGNIIVLGGLLQDQYSDSQDKIPFAGDIPILGNLFRNTSRTRTKTNLMVFIRPLVIRDNVVGDQLTSDRYEQIRSLQQGTQPPNDPMLKNVDAAALLPALPPPPAHRVEGTHLIPPPLSPSEIQQQNNNYLNSGPLKGALPPTADPASGRELP
jgi:general secretion pathway protein D